MTDLIGDICMPKSLVVPSQTGTNTSSLSGTLVFSGAKLYFKSGGSADDWELITST